MERIVAIVRTRSLRRDSADAPQRQSRTARERFPPQKMPIAFPPVALAEPLLSGDAGVEQTINLMRQLVDDSLRDPAIIRLATDIVRPVAAFDDISEVRAIYDWVKHNIRFTKDPINKEKLYPPSELLKIRAGDCDDISILTATLAMAVGHPARLVTVAASPAAPDQFSHVYTEIEVPANSGQWIPADAARFDSEFGVAPPIVTRSRWWSLADSEYGNVSGLGAYPRFRSHVSGMGSYGRVRTMGDDTPPPADQTSSMIATTGQTVASIIRASEGQPASPFDYSSSGPWSSFQTRYSPYGPPAGYASPNLSVSSSSNWLLWGGLALGALLLFGGRK